MASPPLEHEPLIVKNFCCPGAGSPPNVVSLATIVHVFFPTHAAFTTLGPFGDVKEGFPKPVAKLPPTLGPYDTKG